MMPGMPRAIAMVSCTPSKIVLQNHLKCSFRSYRKFIKINRAIAIASSSNCKNGKPEWYSDQHWWSIPQSATASNVITYYYHAGPALNHFFVEVSQVACSSILLRYHMAVYLSLLSKLPAVFLLFFTFNLFNFYNNKFFLILASSASAFGGLCLWLLESYRIILQEHRSFHFGWAQIPNAWWSLLNQMKEICPKNVHFERKEKKFFHLSDK